MTEQYVKLSDVQKMLLGSQRLHSTPMGVMINKYFESSIEKLHSINDLITILNEMIHNLRIDEYVEGKDLCLERALTKIIN